MRNLFPTYANALNLQKLTHLRQPVQRFSSMTGSFISTLSETTEVGLKKRYPLGSSTSQSI